MPVTIKPAGHGANSIVDRSYAGAVKSASDLLKGSCHNEYGNCKELMQSSFGSRIEGTIQATTNGLVNGAIMAYNHHHHLKIRPEDVWFAILSQLSFYINAHSEELRSMFVAHEGKKELVVKFVGNRYTVDYAIFADRMGKLIEENVVDPTLREWMMPAFSTTTAGDRVVASILLMGATQKYFDFTCCISCGLPSVTLLGDKADWKLVLEKLEKLKTFGDEPTQFYSLLKPVVRRFIESFDKPEAAEIIDFWQRIAHYSFGGSGPSYYSGWITAFCFWNNEGRLNSSASRRRDNVLKLDDVIYHVIKSKNVPLGYSTVPVKVDDNGDEFSAMMIAGSVGIGCTSSDGEVTTLDTVQPVTGWWMFEKKSEEELAAEAKDLPAIGGWAS